MGTKLDRIWLFLMLNGLMCIHMNSPTGATISWIASLVVYAITVNRTPTKDVDTYELKKEE